MKFLNSFREKYNVIIEKKYVYDIYLLCIAVFSFLGWTYFSGIASVIKIIFAVPDIPNYLIKKFADTVNKLFTDSERLELYKEAMDMFISSPLNIILEMDSLQNLMM